MKCGPRPSVKQIRHHRPTWRSARAFSRPASRLTSRPGRRAPARSPSDAPADTDPPADARADIHVRRRRYIHRRWRRWRRWGRRRRSRWWRRRRWWWRRWRRQLVEVRERVGTSGDIDVPAANRTTQGRVRLRRTHGHQTAGEQHRGRTQADPAHIPSFSDRPLGGHRADCLSHRPQRGLNRAGRRNDGRPGVDVLDDESSCTHPVLCAKTVCCQRPNHQLSGRRTWAASSCSFRSARYGQRRSEMLGLATTSSQLTFGITM